MIRKFCFLFITCGWVVIFCASSLADDGAGTTTGDFLRVGIGARAAGMGEAFTAVCDDVYSIYWNPAGLANQTTPSLTMMHTKWFASSYADFLGYSADTHKFGTVGLAMQYFSAGKIKETDESGVEKGDFSPTDMALTLAYGREIFKIPLGINLKYISSRITKKATTITFDIGLKYNLPDLFEIGLVGQNLIGQLKYVEKEYPLPRIWKMGIKTRLLGVGICALDMVYPQENSPYVNIGLEFNGQGVTKRMAFRIGYTTRDIKKTEGLSNFSAGLGFGSEKLYLDYAWVPFGDLGYTHRVSINFRFSSSQTGENSSSPARLNTGEKMKSKTIKPDEELIEE